MTDTNQIIEKGNLIQKYKDGQLLTRTTDDSNKVKGISYSRISKFLALPLDQLVKPFNFTLSNEHKFSVYVLSFMDDKIKLRFDSQENMTSYEIVLTVDAEHSRRWKLDKDVKVDPKFGISAADISKLPQRVVNVGVNLPLGYMHQNGLISDRNLAIVVFSYMLNVATKKEIRIVGEVANELGSILFTEITENPESLYFSVRDFFGTDKKPGYYNFNWEHIAAVTKTSKPKMKQLPTLR